MIPEELYYIHKVKSNEWFQCFDRENRNKPVWTKEKKKALVVNELEALKLQRRLDNLYAPRQPILLVEKI